MKKLSDILYKVSLIEISGSTDVEVSDVCFDSRKVQEQSLFVATRGTAVDGHAFIPAVLEKGVAAIICEEFPQEKKEGVTFIKVADSSIALAIAAENFFENPSSKLKVIAVTGTNGKTTVATLLSNLFT